MRFGPVSLDHAEGSTLAHSVVLPDGSRILKGVRLGAHEVARLRDAGIERPTVARLDPGDATEAEAAEEIAARLAGQGLRAGPARAGRATIVSEVAGLLAIAETSVTGVNREVPEIQVATLPQDARVSAGDVVATVKVLPFAVSEERMVAARRALEGQGTLEVRVFRPLRVRMVLTESDGPNTRALELAEKRVVSRIRDLGSSVLEIERVPHEVVPLADRLPAAAEDVDLLLVYGGVSTADLDDVVPRAIRRAGGNVERFGMPVDPGNLLLLGSCGSTPLVGVPACARSPAESGLDRVLERFAVGDPLDGDGLASLGVGGLLRRSSENRSPSVDGPPAPGIAGVVLAAGRSRRMGPRDKLLIEVDGEPMVHRAAAAALRAGLDPVVVVVGDHSEGVRAALGDLPVHFATAVDAEEGMSRSLSTGLAALPGQTRAAVILLADMPGVGHEHIRRIAAAWSPDDGRSICVPTFGRRRGNPVLWDRRFFDEIHRLTGDRGARSLLERHASLVTEVDMPDDAVIFDVDTPVDVPRPD